MQTSLNSEMVFRQSPRNALFLAVRMTAVGALAFVVRMTFTVEWLSRRHCGPLQRGSVTKVSGGGKVALGTPPRESTDDWLVVISGDEMR